MFPRRILIAIFHFSLNPARDLVVANLRFPPDIVIELGWKCDGKGESRLAVDCLEQAVCDAVSCELEPLA